MKSAVVILLLVTLIGVLYAAGIPQQENPQVVQCVNHNDCAPGSCCVISMNRYSYPSCQQQPDLGEQCKPSETREINSTRGYPDGSVLVLEDVYEVMCPCNIGLYCDRTDGTCQVNSE